VRSSAFRLAALCLAAAFGAACSSGSPPGADGDGGADGLGGTAPIIVGGGGSSDNTGGTSGGLIGGGGSSGGDGNCQPTTCEAQGKNCGPIVNGCGDIIECGSCSGDQVCGLVELNVCTSPADACVHHTQAQACAGKECGLESDGCGGTIDCGSCPDGQGCGVEEAFQCGVIVGGSATDCAARIESCASVGARCGLIGNGCGGTIDCTAELGACPSGELCGVDEPQQCGTFAACQPLDPSVACADQCGIVSNGCGAEVNGGVIDCEQTAYGCSSGTCGGSGIPNVCGSGGLQTCQPIAKPAACGSAVCGAASDGCGGSHDCGNGTGCASGTECNAGQCVAVQATCNPVSQSAACGLKECGIVGNGCNGTYDCGSCGVGQQCGAITAFQCDVPPGQQGCVARTQQEACAGKECGIALDGCGTGAGHQLSCGGSTCPNGQFCGVVQAFQCDVPPAPPTCVPNGDTCQSEGWACGTFVNNCGTTSSCGSCNSNETCIGGLAGNPTSCVSVAGNDDDACTLCDAVPSCSGQGQLTRLTGRVITPGQTDGSTANQVRVPNAFVYILRNDNLAELPTITSGLPGSNGTACDRCEDQQFGPVLAGDISDANGDWTIEGNIPVGQQFILVTKVGKFRRAQRMTLPANRACLTTAMPTAMSAGADDAAGSLPSNDNPTRLPRTTTDGLGVYIPRIAVSTGDIDAMECVFYKMGLAASQFGNFGGSNRVDLYRGGPSGNQGATLPSTPADSTLYNSLPRLEAYDMVVSDCEGGGWDSGMTQRGNGDDNSQGGKVRQYVNRGGRMFLSHLSFSWVHQNGTTAYPPNATAAQARATGLGQSSTWDTGLSTNTSGTGVVSIIPGNRANVSPRIETFADWMDAEDVANPPGYTFAIKDPRSQNTGINPGTEEFVYRSDGNGRRQQFSFNTPFAAPPEAACGRVAYSGFHVAATVGQGNTPFSGQTFPNHCTSATLGNNGNLTPQEKILLFMLFDLGTCVGDEPDPPECTPSSCGSSCGTVPNGCGGTMNCGGCAGGQVCDDNVCRPQCVPTTCEAEGVICSTIADGCGGSLTCSCDGVCEPIPEATACDGECGYVSDGCSNVYFCGNCPGACTPLTACPQGIDCGVISDNCNGTLNCGSCPQGQLCGAHDANQCDPPTCRPLTCYEVSAGCGMVGNGCGQAIQCGTCPAGQICTVVNGVPNQCAGCVPNTQQAACAGLECGVVGDGCGGIIDCGNCTVQGQVCGAITPNMCDPGATCTPQVCPSGAECGLMGDGCGDTVSCGTCPAGTLCGLNEDYKCGGCTPRTCETAGANCGLIGNGCGGQIDCGECTQGSTCGLGQPNKCAQIR
jgi:hypothetical protein